MLATVCSLAPTASLAEWKVVRLESGRPGFNSCAVDLFLGWVTPVATMLGAWRYCVNTGNGRPGVSLLWQDKFDLQLRQCRSTYTCLSRSVPEIGYASMLLGRCLIGISSPVHVPRCAGEIHASFICLFVCLFFVCLLFFVFLFFFCCCFFFFGTEGNSWSLWERPRARERAMDVIMQESFRLVPPCIRPDGQRSRLFPTAVQPIGTCVHRRLWVCYR